jgi:Bacterial SH3 domain
MRNFFPNIETAVIFVFLICIMLWGVSRCRKKKDEAAMRTATEQITTPLDTLGVGSPAASRTPRPPAQSATPPPTTINTAPSYPTYGASQPLPSSPTAQPAPSQVPQSYNTPQSYNAPPPSAPPMVSDVTTKSPTTTPKSVAPTTTTTEVSGTPLYVIINGLNVRTKPELNAKSMGRLKLSDIVYFQNEKTDVPQAVRLADGTSVSKPWFKIKTKRGTVGWVHGSGVDFYKRKPTEGL